MNVSKRSKLLDTAFEGGDLALVKDLEHDNFFDFVMSKVMTGQYEDIETQSQDILDSSETEFRELGGYTEETLPSSEVNARKIEVVEATRKRAAKIKKAVEKVDAELRLSEREKVLDSEKPGTMGYVRKQLIHSLSVMDNVQEREEAIIKEVAKLTGGKISNAAWTTTKTKDSEAGERQDRTSTIDYTDADGNVKSVDIGAFYEDAPIRAAIAQMDSIINALEAGEKTEEVKKQLDELYDRKLELSEYAKEVGEDNILSGEEYEKIIKPWQEVDPDGVVVNGEQVQTYLKDLRKLRARRQKAVEMYKQLMDPTYRPQAIQSIQDKINAMDTDLTEAEKAAKERKEKKEKEQIENFKSKIVEAKKVTLRQIEAFENQLKETQALIDSYLEDLTEIADKLEAGQKNT
jgi:N-glycosylase/DNA lyase